MQIFIKDIANGQTLALYVKPGDTIFDVKVLLEKKASFTLPYQRLIFANKSLEDHQILRNCNIEDDSTLKLTFSLNKNKYVREISPLSKANASRFQVAVKETHTDTEKAPPDATREKLTVRFIQSVSPILKVSGIPKL